MACPICGLHSGTHTGDCIRSLIATNTKTLSKIINLLYNELNLIGRRGMLNKMDVCDTLDEVDAELKLLREVNGAVTSSTRASEEENTAGKQC